MSSTVHDESENDHDNDNKGEHVPVLVLSEADVQSARLLTLQRWHLAAFVFFFIQTIIYAAVPVSLQVDATVAFSTDCDGPICGPGQKNLGSFNPIWMIPLFTGLAALDHLLCCLSAQFYPEQVKYWIFVVGSNPMRWLEYSISASIMAVAISILSGVKDVHLWFLIFMMHAVGMFLGFVIEIIPKEDPNKTVDNPNTDTENEADSREPPISFLTIRKFLFGIASVSIFTPWLVICCYFFHAVTTSADNVPNFVYGAFLGTLLLFITFGVNSFCHNIMGYYDFPYAEVVYVILSFTSKTFLAADVFGGLKAGEDNDDGQPPQ